VRLIEVTQTPILIKKIIKKNTLPFHVVHVITHMLSISKSNNPIEKLFQGCCFHTMKMCMINFPGIQNIFPSNSCIYAAFHCLPLDSNCKLCARLPIKKNVEKINEKKTLIIQAIDCLFLYFLEKK
jgi:hypothetical protein